MATKGSLALALSMVLKQRARELGDGEALDAFLPTEDAANALLAEVFALAGTDTCFVKAADNEPLFVLRAQDRCAPATVRDWAERARGRGDASAAKAQDAMDCALNMESWAERHGSKDPD